ncbi:hypothetical protein [Rhizobium sp. AAP43]|uniref:hypothetical protein n=1 Tax=Rhizobium sp. AAP43 TaxID=1523420 RepID=UPI0006B9E5E3|nr:hypothetical protein [Rhizobium sp. AAP43]KPF47087.1 hypothetical protein IP76_01965 [Rhizobium sp. AAP43]
MISGQVDHRRRSSAAMSGKVSDLQALAAIVLWNSGHFDTLEISQVIGASEDAVYRTLHAARHIAKGGRP